MNFKDTDIGIFIVITFNFNWIILLNHMRSIHQFSRLFISGHKMTRQRKNQGKDLNECRQNRMRGEITENREISEDGGVWNIPKPTLQHRAKGDGHYHHPIERKPFVHVEDKAILVRWLQPWKNRDSPWRWRTLKHWQGMKRFSEITGYKWSLRWNSSLSIRKPDTLSTPGAAGVCCEGVLLKI